MELKDEVRSIVAEVLEIPASQLPINAEMDEIAEWDSMHNVLVLSRLEEYYDILFPEDDIFNLVSVEALAEEIDRLKA